MNRRDFIKYGTILAGMGGTCLLLKNGNLFVQDIPDTKNIPDNKPCSRPFDFCEFNRNGDIYPCCPDFLKYKTPAGNIGKQNIDKIWNGKIFNDLRQRVLNGDYTMCNRNICSMYNPCPVSELPENYKKGPKEIKITYDYECNYKCITCRDVVKINTPEEMALYENVYLPKVLEAAKNSKTVNLLGVGDPLFSRHSRHLIMELVKKYPKIKFTLCTNGLLLDEKNLAELGIQNNLLGISVSIDSVKRETYKKILRTDAFDTVMKNVELMAEWKRQGKFNWLLLNFVVHLLNYKEMPEFVRIAQKLDATVFFSTYRPWDSAEFSRRYDEVAVFEPENKHYKELVKILHNPVFKDDDHCILEQTLYDIANS